LLPLSVKANDIRMSEVRGFELSFGSRIGMSGGPVVDQEDGKVLGLLSLGLPPDATIKTQTFAVSIEEVRDRVDFSPT
jgi:S1-C subfamily serine protease